MTGGTYGSRAGFSARLCVPVLRPVLCDLRDRTFWAAAAALGAHEMLYTNDHLLDQITFRTQLSQVSPPKSIGQLPS